LPDQGIRSLSVEKLTIFGRSCQYGEKRTIPPPNRLSVHFTANMKDDRILPYMKKKALFIGRFAPPHKGHIEAIINLASEFDEVVIGLGSCYEVGSPRHPFQAVYREKMILFSLYETG
jgi:cytidyltransferase-like protein